MLNSMSLDLTCMPRNDVKQLAIGLALILRNTTKHSTCNHYRLSTLMFQCYCRLFYSNLGGEAEKYELHLVVKDRCYTRSDRVVGVGVLQLRELIEMGSRWMHLPLGHSVVISEMGRAIVGILYGRSQDEIVKDFVHIKYTKRPPELD